MKTLAIFPFNDSDIEKVDPRLLSFTKDWYVREIYKDKLVHIPNTWNSKFTILNYFQVVKSPSDPNPGEDENEIGMTLLGGWFPYDSEVMINLFISGKNVLNPNECKVSAEILKLGSAPMTVMHNGKFVTDFTKKVVWWTVKKDKIWINDLSKLG